MRRPRLFALIAIAVAIVALGACTATQPRFADALDLGKVPGFWKGFWHGFIAPITFIVSLISDDVKVYAFPNSGRWYEFGFMLGISGFSGGVFAGSRSGKSGTG